LLSLLLTLGTLQATPVSRTAPFAQVRSSVCLVLVEILQQEAPDPERPRTTWPDQISAPFRIDHRERTDPWLGSEFRFQRPPPAVALQAFFSAAT
jgi:hypothetical protein